MGVTVRRSPTGPFQVRARAHAATAMKPGAIARDRITRAARLVGTIVFIVLHRCNGRWNLYLQWDLAGSATPTRRSNVSHTRPWVLNDFKQCNESGQLRSAAALRIQSVPSMLGLCGRIGDEVPRRPQPSP